MPKAKRRVKNRDNNRRAKKKISVLTSEKIEYVDWKDVNLLRRFMSERAKIRSRRVTGNNAQQQKLVADAIKVAREMALVAYSNRVTTQRQGKDRSSRLWSDTPMPRPAMPPPGGATDQPVGTDPGSAADPPGLGGPGQSADLSGSAAADPGSAAPDSAAEKAVASEAPGEPLMEAGRS